MAAYVWRIPPLGGGVGGNQGGLDHIYLEPETRIYKWLFQLDDEPNLYMGSAWKSPLLSI